jgi:hypothetical protein
MTDCYACYTDEQVRLVLGGNGARVLRISGTPRDNSRMVGKPHPTLLRGVARHAFRICLARKPVKYNLASCFQESGHEGAVSNAVTTA